MQNEVPEEVGLFMQQLGIADLDKNMFYQALTHKSFANELSDEGVLPVHNERLEFLGDAVLSLIIARELFKRDPDMDEGMLTRKKAELVCEPTLYHIGQRLNLGIYLRLGKGEKAYSGEKKPSNIANAIEAIIAAVYLSGGFESASKLVLNLWHNYLEGGEIPFESFDFKSRLQEYLVKKKHGRPEYKVINSDGPEHARIFTVGLFIKGTLCSEASGPSKKKAEQQAARSYLKKNGIILN